MYIAKVFLLSAATYGHADLVTKLSTVVDNLEFNDIEESCETPSTHPHPNPRH